MRRTRTTRLIAGAVALGLGIAACGGDDDAADESAETVVDEQDDQDEPAAGVLAEVCPSPLVIQTDWFPESEYGAVYNLIGDDYEVDTAQKVVTGTLVSEGVGTGIDVEVRTGGPAIGFASPRVQMYSDDSIHLGFSTLDEGALTFESAPLISVVAPLEKNPQIIMWDADTYPDIETIEDLGDAGVTINIFGGGGFSQVFVSEGIWSADQVDPSYDGSPARFIAEGDIAQQGFASNEPYEYEFSFTEYGKRPAYQLLHDAGYEWYSQTLAVKPGDLEELRSCLELLVPIVQRSSVEFLNSPERTNAMIVDAVEQFADFWTYSEGVAEYAVETMRELGLMGNGHNGTAGDMDLDRINAMIEKIIAAGAEVPDGVTAEVLITNEFIDPSIGY
jgi:hypothetical protein